MVIVPIPTASQLAMIFFARWTQINKKGRRRFTRITLTDSGQRAGICSPFPSSPAPRRGRRQRAAGTPRSSRRGCWGAGPEQEFKAEGQSPPQELTPQPGSRSHPTTPAQAKGAEPGAGHRPRLAPHDASTSRAARPGGELAALPGTGSQAGGSEGAAGTSQRRLLK